jgi:hypothetical protein
MEEQFFDKRGLCPSPDGHELWKQAHLYAKRRVIIAGAVLGKAGMKFVSL